MKVKGKLSWRIVWYSVLIWGATFVLAGFVVLPWFYIALPLVIFWTTAYFFRRSERTFIAGLTVSLFWFSVILALNFIELIGPYYANFPLYFSDFRNWFLYPLVLLIPVVYTLISENSATRKNSKTKHLGTTDHQVQQVA
ncbi:MAG: hypothetical protein ACD_57C00053G0002 [uncultured bacterium]|uniref:Uncharacterized protein n=1 Tax=Candidatus Curtissbacteria bacterium RIFOXYA1_FULL_41_14 TaxID=1797737 RepID=A0A1F5HED2_9BACT|nr:MAG: hypothetical protein ACD_57C00053G0002 [uncultured bacterium]OGD81275.1 MAG: hypothetical protein A2683_03000 [Candidatus Curtissbacteria bacterium RIFCSPHIGHO2_01_FULL_34_40]OGD91638.1 MAG: hypothetical protein A3E14_03050 [Candidatus Curtissbacteria bacterium RIFCSPHIGHO2_12_FULL_41_13]OGD96250.1 MAG: hypothetical protein A3B52_00895 [Candidatus Curtissbacteria bacterium RIFCSPLOWO2_01_FULL_41_28]OGE02501.1 MAG: hypothetical protein A2196_01585 [Candidatus Curtissbacteria bacterium RI